MTQVTLLDLLTSLGLMAPVNHLMSVFCMQPSRSERPKPQEVVLAELTESVSEGIGTPKKHIYHHTKKLMLQYLGGGAPFCQSSSLTGPFQYHKNFTTTKPDDAYCKSPLPAVPGLGRDPERQPGGTSPKTKITLKG
jgi:hypothetical protein